MALQTPLVLGAGGIPIELPKADTWRPQYQWFQKGISNYEMWVIGGDSHGSSGSSTGASHAGLILVPWVIPFRMTFDRVGIQLAGGATSATGGIGIYAVTTVNDDLTPAARLFQTDSLDFSTSGAKTATIDWSLDAGWYWIALFKSDAAVTYYPRAASTSLNLGMEGGPSGHSARYTLIKSSATLDNPCPSGMTFSTTILPPSVGFRRSA
jgi:hypothetical protein